MQYSSDSSQELYNIIYISKYGNLTCEFTEGQTFLKVHFKMEDAKFVDFIVVQISILQSRMSFLTKS